MAKHQSDFALELRHVRTRLVSLQQLPGVVGTGVFFGEDAGKADFAAEWLEVLQHDAGTGFGSKMPDSTARRNADLARLRSACAANDALTAAIKLQAGIGKEETGEHFLQIVPISMLEA
jgi:hypothetical protein